MFARIQDLEKHTPISFYDVGNQFKEFVYARSEEVLARGDRDRELVTDADDLVRRQQQVRAALLDAIGGLPPSGTPLNARVTGTVRGDGFTVEKIIFESRPQVYVTANLYLPDGLTEPAAAVQFLCGHDSQAKHCDEFQTVIQHLVYAGLVVLAQDPVGQGERFSYYESSIGRTTVADGTREHTYAGQQCLPLGDTAARYVLHDAVRGLDYLSSRPEVDPARIGVTGNSGGGLQTMMMMVVDDRIAAAAPATYLSSRRTILRSGVPQDAEQTWVGMSAAGFDHEDVLLCMAPRPVLVLGVTYDFFPIEGTRESVARARRYWRTLGDEQDLRLIEHDSVHAYTPAMAQAAAGFFAATLAGNASVPVPHRVHLLEPKSLWCTGSGQIRAEIPGARFIFDENAQRLAEVEARRNLIPDELRRGQSWQWLAAKVADNRKPVDLNPKHTTHWQVMDLTVTSSIWWSQQALLNHSLTFRSYAFAGHDIPITLAVWDGGTTRIQRHISWIRRTCDAGRAVVVLNASGVGSLLPARMGGKGEQFEVFGALHILADALLWLGDSTAALRTYDVLRAIDALAAWPHVLQHDLRLYAHGRQGLYARLAAFLDDRVLGLEVEEAMVSFAEWVGSRYYDAYNMPSLIIPGMLKHFDLPDLDRWSARDSIR